MIWPLDFLTVLQPWTGPRVLTVSGSWCGIDHKRFVANRPYAVVVVFRREFLRARTFSTVNGCVSKPLKNLTLSLLQPMRKCAIVSGQSRGVIATQSPPHLFGVARHPICCQNFLVYVTPRRCRCRTDSCLLRSLQGDRNIERELSHRNRVR